MKQEVVRCEVGEDEKIRALELERVRVRGDNGTGGWWNMA